MTKCYWKLRYVDVSLAPGAVQGLGVFSLDFVVFDRGNRLRSDTPDPLRLTGLSCDVKRHQTPLLDKRMNVLFGTVQSCRNVADG